jgi:hypothetical protein
MFSHLGAVLLASGALVLLSTVHSMPREAFHPEASIMLVAASATAVSPDHQVSDAPLRAIAIGY